MSTPADRTTLQLRSLVKASGELELSLVSVSLPVPLANEVVIRVDAAPLNPSDLGLLFGAADPSTAKFSGTSTHPIVTAQIPSAAMRAMAGRVDQSMPVGNEGAGLVVEAGSSPAAQALLGKKVAALGGGMYAQLRTVAAEQCLLLPEGATAEQGASSFVNPLTALGMITTMKNEGHRALVHTAAASSLGQMLQRLCLHDGIPLVNIVRTAEQEAMLRSIGATHVLSSRSPDFQARLADAVAETGATIAFDAIGGGKLPGQILTAMESALNRGATVYNRYGSSTHKQVYIYGGLDTAPTELSRTFGMAWSIGGWLMTHFLERIGPAAAQPLKDRVARELTTTFATSYSTRVTLAEALRAEAIAGYSKRATGEKYLILPNGTI